jgi:hypothetical protein
VGDPHPAGAVNPNIAFNPSQLATVKRAQAYIATQPRAIPPTPFAPAANPVAAWWAALPTWEKWTIGVGGSLAVAGGTYAVVRALKKGKR